MAYQFNPDKQELLRVTNGKSPVLADYIIHGEVLDMVDSAKYFGLTIHKSLSRDSTSIDKSSRKQIPPSPFWEGKSAYVQHPSRHRLLHPSATYNVPSNTPPACGAQLRRKTIAILRRCSVGQLDSPLVATSVTARWRACDQAI